MNAMMLWEMEIGKLRMDWGVEWDWVGMASVGGLAGLAFCGNKGCLSVSLRNRYEL